MGGCVCSNIYSKIYSAIIAMGWIVSEENQYYIGSEHVVIRGALSRTNLRISEVLLITHRKSTTNRRVGIVNAIS